MKRIIIAAALAVCGMPPLSPAAIAAGPGKGEMTKYNVHVGDGCYADSVTVRWNLDSLMGEATQNGSWKYSGDCRPNHEFMIWLRVEGAGSYGFVRIAPAHPSRPGKWAFNVTGSPSWDKALCGYSGSRKGRCHPAAEAKAIWKDGRVTDFRTPFPS